MPVNEEKLAAVLREMDNLDRRGRLSEEAFLVLLGHAEDAVGDDVTRLQEVWRYASPEWDLPEEESEALYRRGTLVLVPELHRLGRIVKIHPPRRTLLNPRHDANAVIYEVHCGSDTLRLAEHEVAEWE
jgi:hypothetical protein